MQIEYPIEWVLEIFAEMKLERHSVIGHSLSFKRNRIGRRVVIPILPNIPEYVLVDNLEAAGLLDEYYAARDRVVARKSS